MIRDSLRYWRRHPLDALWIVAVLGIGLATAVAAASVARAVLWRPLPVVDASRLVRVFVESRDPDGGLFPTEYVLWRERQKALSAIASYQFEPPLYLHLTNDIVRLNGLSVTTNMFETLGVQPVHGRAFVAADADDSGRPVIITERLWARVFGRRPDIIGQTLSISDGGRPLRGSTVIGVLPPDLEIQDFFMSGVDVYRPVTDGVPPEWFGLFRTNRRYVIGRLAPGVSEPAAGRELSATARAVAMEIPTPQSPTGARTQSLHETVFSHARRYGLLLGLCVQLMLGASLLNSCSVLMALAASRVKEHSIRRALGAAEARLIRQAFSEAIVLAVTAGAIGLLLGHWLIRATAFLISSRLPRVESAGIGFEETALLAVSTVCVAALLTAIPIVFQKERSDTSCLREGAPSMSPRTLRTRLGLIAAQQAVVLAIVAAAGLSGTTLWHLLHRPLGFDPRGLLAAEVAIHGEYANDPRRYASLVADLAHQVRDSAAMPDVAIANNLPLRGRIDHAAMWNSDGRRLDGTSASVTPGFFDVMRIPVLAGRTFQPRDDPETVVVVNQKFATTYFEGPGQAIGRHLKVGSRQHLSIVGVVGDVLEHSIVGDVRPMVYVFFGGQDVKFSRLFVVARARDESDTALTAMRTAIRNVDAGLYVNVARFSDRVTDQSADVRLQSAALIPIGVVTLAIVGLGIFALIGQLTFDCQRESAIRVSLGATPARAIAAAILPLTKAVLIALPLGALAGWAILRVLPAVVPTLVPATNMFWIGAALLIIAMNCISAVFPVVRALRLNVTTALRQQ